MTKVEIDYLVNGLTTFAWGNDYKRFCEVLNLTWQSDVATDKWNNFQLLVNGLKVLSKDELLTLVEAGHK